MGKKQNIILKNIHIDDYAAEGRSLAKVNGKVIFVENAVPGDIVNLRLTKNKKDWAEAIPTNYISFSPDRVKPFCQHFGVCGGCQWQMLPYEKQLMYKQLQVQETLKRIGKIDLPEVLPVIGASETKYYRNKVEYTFANKRYLLPHELHDPAVTTENEVAGYHAKGIFDKVIDIQMCYLQQEPTNTLRLAVKKFAKEKEYSFYDIREHKGFMRTMQIRICSTGEIMVNMVFGYDDQKKIKPLLNHILKMFPSITTLLYTINTKWNDSLNDLDPVTYSGKGFVIEKLEDFKFKIGPKSFFQTNTRQAERLYLVTKELADISDNDIVYDLYCGTGSIGIFLSRNAKKIIGVELMQEAVKDAVENAALNNLQHAHFFTGDVSEVCNNDFFAEQGRPDVIVSDPPRAGMHPKLIQKILEMQAATVVYVSCNPATQARDLNLLSEKYSVTYIQPVDMFPHTHHIENVVQLKFKSGL